MLQENPLLNDLGANHTMPIDNQSKKLAILLMVRQHAMTVRIICIHTHPTVLVHHEHARGADQDGGSDE